MDQITLEAQTRSALGKKNGALRRSGITPFHVYGPDTPSASLQADTATLIHALNEAGYTTPITVAVGSEEHFAVVQRIQRHPVTDHLIHVDLITISRTQRMTAAVPLHFEGESLAAREAEAQIFEDLHELEVEALPLEMPHLLMVDLSALVAMDSVVHAADVTLPANVTLVTDAAAPVVRIVVRRGAEIDGGGGEGVAPAATAAAPAAAASSGAASDGEAKA
jgi:large subunit ribosomal protein L25